MKQAPRSKYVCINSYLVKPRRCFNPNLHFKSGPSYDFDFEFGFIYWLSILDRKWASDDQSKRKMAYEAWNNESWHDKSTFWSLEKENLYCEAIEEVEIQILGKSDWVSRSWQPIIDWCSDVPFWTPIRIFIYDVHITWVNLWMSCFIYIDFRQAPFERLSWDDILMMFGNIINEHVWVLP